MCQMEKKSKVLVVGGTGYIGSKIVRASLAQGHTTYVLQRPDMNMDVHKLQTLLSFKALGARLVEGSFSDHRSLVDAVKLVDVVICAVSGLHYPAGNILGQLKLVEAIKEAGNIKRFLPSEFGMDPSRMEHAMEPGNATFIDKMVVRKAIEEAQIPYTYVSANCFGAYFAGNLSQIGMLFPPRDRVCLYGDGSVKAIYVHEDDAATYTIKTIDDPRTLNKTIYLRPPDNILSQRQLVEKWENLICKKLEKLIVPAEPFLASIKDMDFGSQVAASHCYHIFYEGCLTNFEIVEEEEASKLYPEVDYTRMDAYLKRYL